MSSKRDYYQQERDRVAASEVKNARPIFKIERGLDSQYHVIGMLRNGKIIHEKVESIEEAELLINIYKEAE